MIKVENIETWGFEHAIRGMRNPMNSWDKSDSYPEVSGYTVGDNDLRLMRSLYKASLTGNHAHRKYLRQIFVSMDITAPLYWWKEFDTYKVGTVANSCSTMHKIHDKVFTIDDFSHEHLDGELSITKYHELQISGWDTLSLMIQVLNGYRQKYLETHDKKWWWQMIQLLPTSYNQKRTVTMNYENAIVIILQRTAHKLDEWRKFVDILSLQLPYLDEITKEE